MNKNIDKPIASGRVFCINNSYKKKILQIMNIQDVQIEATICHVSNPNSQRQLIPSAGQVNWEGSGDFVLKPE